MTEDKNESFNRLADFFAAKESKKASKRKQKAVYSGVRVGGHHVDRLRRSQGSVGANLRGFSAEEQARFRQYRRDYLEKVPLKAFGSTIKELRERGYEELAEISKTAATENAYAKVIAEKTGGRFWEIVYGLREKRTYLVLPKKSTKSNRLLKRG